MEKKLYSILIEDTGDEDYNLLFLFGNKKNYNKAIKIIKPYKELIENEDNIDDDDYEDYEMEREDMWFSVIEQFDDLIIGKIQGVKNDDTQTFDFDYILER